MNIQTLREGLALMGATLGFADNSVMFELNGVTVLIQLDLSEKEMEAAFFFLKLNAPNWYKVAKEAIEEEKRKEGGSHEQD